LGKNKKMMSSKVFLIIMQIFSVQVFAAEATSFIREEVESEKLKAPKIEHSPSENSVSAPSNSSPYPSYEEANKKTYSGPKRVPAQETQAAPKKEYPPPTGVFVIQNPERATRPVQPVPPEVETEHVDGPVKPQVIVIKENDKKIDGVSLLKELDLKGIKAKMMKEDPVNLVYYLEVRYQNRLTVTKSPTFYAEPVHFLKSGQIIKIDDNVEGYIDKLRLEKKGLGSFKRIKVYDPKDIDNDRANSKELYVFDEFSSAYTISPFEQPVTMMPVFSVEWPVVPVFSQPGKFTAKDCDQREDLCVGWLDSYATIFLVDTKVIFDGSKPNPQDRMDVYYYIGYEYKLPSGEMHRGAGWVHSQYLQRKIDTLSTQLVATRNPSSSDFILPPNSESESLYIFGKNRKQTEKLSAFTKNLSEKRARELASIWSIKLDYQAFTDMTSSKVTHSWLNEPFTIAGPSVGMQVSAPIFLDLVIKGSGKLTLPAVSSDTSKKPILFKTEEWLEVTTPANLNEMPIKLGLGAYYFTMLNTTSDYGVNSLLGLQFRVLYEDDDFWSYIKYAPVGNSLQIRPENRDIGVALGVKMKKNSWFDSWGAYGEYIDMSYTSPTNNTTQMQQSNLGIFFDF
jgi:hypothetical protein